MAKSKSVSRGRLRQVSFRSGRVRVGFGALGLLCGIVGFWLAGPAFRGTPDPPEPWGLWVSSDLTGGAQGEPSWILQMSISADHGCGAPATATGELRGGIEGARSRRPRLLVLSVAGRDVLSAEVTEKFGRLGDAYGWRPMRLARFRTAFIAEGRLRAPSEAYFFRLRLNAAESAGYSSCYVTSPSLFGLTGANAEWDLANQMGEIHRSQSAPDPKPLAYSPVKDAILQMSAPGMLPDRGSLDAGAIVRSDGLQVTCTGLIPQRPAAAEGDEFFYERTLAEQSSCASVQTFRAGDIDAELNRRLFLAGVLLSIAVGLLFEAVVSGRVEPSPA